MDSTTTILYVSSSMRSMHWNSLDVSYCDFVEPSSMNTPISTLVDISYTSHMSPNLDDAYVNLVSHEDASRRSSSSYGILSSIPIIFHYDEDIMKTMITVDYLWVICTIVLTSFCSKPMTNMLWSQNTSSMVRLIASITPYFELVNSKQIHVVEITLPHNVWVRGHPFFRVQEK